MSATSLRISTFAIFLLIGSLWLGAGPTVAANAPLNLPPMPEELPTPAAQPPSKGHAAAKIQPQASPFQEEATATDECCEDSEPCNLPMCGPPGRVWLRADYLMWWTNGIRLPPLVTTSPQGTAPGQAGVLPNAEILYGNHTVATDGQSGFRTTLGLWLDSCHLWGAEVDYFSPGQRDSGFYQDSPTGNPILARPFFNVQTNQPGSLLVSYASQPGQPNLATGSITVGVKDYFQSGGVLLSHNLCGDNSCCDCCNSCDEGCATDCCVPLTCCRRTDLLMGFRYYNLSDGVAITENMRDLSGGRTNLWTFNTLDSFRARNDFYGGEVGLRTQVYRGRWSLEFLTKLAMGDNRTIVGIMGTTTATPLTQPTQPTAAGGVLALNGANIGTYHESNAFTMIPELGVDLGYQLNCHWRAHLGYNVLYWGCVSRAADQISLDVDPRNIPSNTSVYNPSAALAFPQFPDKTSCFWAQGSTRARNSGTNRFHRRADILVCRACPRVKGGQECLPSRAQSHDP